MEPLASATWRELASAHYAVVDPWIQPRLDRRSRLEKHPVDDFLFEYYPISPAKLRAWHPGFGISLQASEEDFEIFNSRHYSFENGVISLRTDWLTETQDKIRNMRNFLELTSARPTRTGCFGLHEWAMVLGQNEVRHDAWPLRLSQDAIRQTIYEQGLRCTHFDAFRFFTDEARPLNPIQLVREDQLTMEQPGCLHANMDLYKHAFAFAPVLGSDIVRDAFALAKDIREVDMQVAPYDLAPLGVTPIAVETANGRAEFARRQNEFATRASTIR
jgi:hypothetical protein